MAPFRLSFRSLWSTIITKNMSVPSKSTLVWWYGGLTTALTLYDVEFNLYAYSWISSNFHQPFDMISKLLLLLPLLPPSYLLYSSLLFPYHISPPRTKIPVQHAHITLTIIYPSMVRMLISLTNTIKVVCIDKPLWQYDFQNYQQKCTETSRI